MDRNILGIRWDSRQYVRDDDQASLGGKDELLGTCPFLQEPDQFIPLAIVTSRVSL